MSGARVALETRARETAAAERLAVKERMSVPRLEEALRGERLEAEASRFAIQVMRDELAAARDVLQQEVGDRKLRDEDAPVQRQPFRRRFAILFLLLLRVCRR